MSKEYSRSDFITDLASARARADHHERSRLPISVVPDLRFEPTFMKKISPYVHVTRPSTSDAPTTKGSEGNELVRVEWTKVIWITAKDQIISPLLQGALWGTASIFLRPLVASLSAQFKQWWPAYRQPPPGREGKGVGLLRHWVHGLFGVSLSPQVQGLK